MKRYRIVIVYKADGIEGVVTTTVQQRSVVAAIGNALATLQRECQEKQIVIVSVSARLTVCQPVPISVAAYQEMNACPECGVSGGGHKEGCTEN